MPSEEVTTHWALSNALPRWTEGLYGHFEGNMPEYRSLFQRGHRGVRQRGAVSPIAASHILTSHHHAARSRARSPCHRAMLLPKRGDTFQAGLTAPGKVVSPYGDTAAGERGISGSKPAPTSSFTTPTQVLYGWTGFIFWMQREETTYWGSSPTTFLFLRITT
ncbi:hypothetical protein EYF80_026134 [Liparis tanakae]|uniref:Uncharacterized protein n=1 Tax=Liparis tanakae TaxID=230148 RepID=A0A4Z2HCK6_9TELE|nr:hypothetical protein EYF80_026134 [Liparis tanakae]